MHTFGQIVPAEEIKCKKAATTAFYLHEVDESYVEGEPTWMLQVVHFKCGLMHVLVEIPF